ncbi:hypothetical protein BDF19DRAFT_259311 [Syncephalis fuscata]|nr:hypothetical protein BDF19DRAFT_259311 [Syncephalis fuscata]
MSLKIMNLAETDVQRIKEHESKVFNTLDKHSTSAPTTKSIMNWKARDHDAIVIWPNTGNSTPNIIYLGDRSANKQQFHIDNPVTIYNDWILLRNIYEKDSYRVFDLIDLSGNKLIKGPKMHMRNSDACIQFASHNQCQLLTWSIMPSPIEDRNTPTSETAQTLHATGRDNKSLNLQWEAFDFQKDQHQCKRFYRVRSAFRIVRTPSLGPICTQRRCV